MLRDPFGHKARTARSQTSRNPHLAKSMEAAELTATLANTLLKCIYSASPWFWILPDFLNGVACSPRASLKVKPLSCTHNGHHLYTLLSHFLELFFVLNKRNRAPPIEFT